MTFYLGLDQALAYTGWAVVSYKEGEWKLESIGQIETNTRQDTTQRINQIIKTLGELIVDYKPAHCYTEVVYHGHSLQVTKTLSGVEACIHLKLYQEGIPWTVLDTKVWKPAIGSTVKGKEDLLQLTDHLRMPCATAKRSNIADAIGIVLGGLISDNKLNLNIAKAIIANGNSTIKFRSDVVFTS